MSVISIGDTVRIYATVLLGGVPTDPTTLEIAITSPAGPPATTYEWPTDPEVVRDGTGQFHFDLAITQSGTWSFQWDAAGAVVSIESGEIDVADPGTVKTVDDATPTPNDVPYVDFALRDSESVVAASGQTDASGSASIVVADGTFELSASKTGWRFPPVSVDITGAGPHTLTIVGTLRLTSYLTPQDLESCAGPGTVDLLFNDDNTGLRNAALMENVMLQAEGVAASRMLRGWTKEQIAVLAANDEGFRCHVAWVALEMATERRGEFISADGKGRYWAQYERAIDHFSRLSKSKIHSLGEVVAGTNLNTGGMVRPTLQAGQPRHVFADEPDGTKHGGFVIPFLFLFEAVKAALWLSS